MGAEAAGQAQGGGAVPPIKLPAWAVWRLIQSARRASVRVVFRNPDPRIHDGETPPGPAVSGPCLTMITIVWVRGSGTTVFGPRGGCSKMPSAS